MDDLISRASVEDLIMETDPWWCEGMTRAIFEGIKRLPTIDHVKRGKWLKTGQSFVYPDKFRNYFCSVCGFELDTHIRQEPNYCPHCGARMEMERSEE